ncbi:MAG: LysM peptidoglycan-binding domain-containing protein [Planctomycetes bacterium]|nr:LysM peptidoglycan-binding domain-containing protein [Planctomycetota bacterium]
MTKVDYHSSDRGLQPRLGALLVMIIAIIGVFALISRIDQIIAYLTPVSSAGVGNNPNTDSQGRIISVIDTNPDQYQHPLTRSTSPSAEKVEAERISEKSPPKVEKAILPRRPGKGCKLSDSSELVALKDCSPAETNTRVPPADSHQRAIYTIGGTSVCNAFSEENSPRLYILRETDTLWSIAARTYGNGKYYTRILAANPGLQADRLPVGKTITLPEDSAN